MDNPSTVPLRGEGRRGGFVSRGERIGASGKENGFGLEEILHFLKDFKQRVDLGDSWPVPSRKAFSTI